MRFTLIICTYMRPKTLLKLLNSIKHQVLYPNEILIIDGSINTDTKAILDKHSFKNLKYYQVGESNRGLTKQRNYGVKLVDDASEVICFLDDDTILESNYFKELISTYSSHSSALAVGGYITNEVHWKKSNQKNESSKFYYDGWMRTEPSRFRIRQKLGLLPKVKPGFMPSFSHGRSVGFLPPSGKIYEVELIMGGVSSYRKEVFEKLNFSNYFEGYGLYEDADFSLRISKLGKIYVNTLAQLEHHHNELGRPNKFRYGKMVIRNGWYVWRVKHPKPNFKARLKWNSTAFLLTTIRFTNIFTTESKKEAFTEALGRVMGWWSLLFNRPKFAS